MPGPRPDDPYNPTQSVSPTTGVPGDYLNVRSTPASFGGQVGEAVQKLGATGTQVANETLNTMTQYQGMLNETWIADASSKQNAQIGDVDGWYKSLKGPAAAAAYPEAQARVQKIRQDILATAPNPAAARGFNIMAARAEGFTLRDYGNYMGSQIKEGRTQANAAQLSTIQQKAADPSVFSDPLQWGNLVGSIKDLAAKIVSDQGHGPDPISGVNPSGMSIDNKGNVTFNNTPQGQEGQAVFTQYLNQELGKAWDARLQAEASDNPLLAQKTLEDFGDRIPPETKANWSYKLRGAVNAADTANFSNGIIAQTESRYYQNLTPQTGPITAAPAWLHNATQQQESQNNPNAISPRGAVGQMQVMPRTLTDPGYGVSPAHITSNMTPEQKQAEYKRVGDDYLNAMYKKYNGNPLQALVAYNWGPVNADNWIKKGADFTTLPAETQVYLSKILPKGMGATGGSLNQVDFYRLHEPQILNDTFEQAMNRYGDITLANQAVAHTEQKINLIKQQADDQIRVQKDQLIQLVKGDDQHPPITSMAQLEGPAADPQVRALWLNYKGQDWYGSNAIESLVSSRNKGVAKTYGTDFYTHLQDVLNGRTSNSSDLGPYMKLSGGTPEDAAVTNTGYWYLNNQIKQIHDDQNGAVNSAFAKEESKALQILHDQATGVNIHNNLKSPKLEYEFNKNLITLTNRIDSERAAGKTSAQLFHPDSPDYIGKYIQLPKPADVQSEYMKQVMGTLSIPDTKATEGIFKAMNDTQGTPDQKRQYLIDAANNNAISRKQADAIALKYGLIGAPQPQAQPVPVPH